MQKINYYHLNLTQNAKLIQLESFKIEIPSGIEISNDIGIKM